MPHEKAFLCVILYPRAYLSCPFSFVYFSENPGSSFVLMQPACRMDSVRHTSCPPCYKWAEFSPAPLTAVVRRKRKSRTADGEVIIKWNAFSPFASSNTRGTF